MSPHLIIFTISFVSSFRIPPLPIRSTTIRYYYPVRDKEEASVTTTSPLKVVNPTNTFDQFEVINNVINSLVPDEESSDILIPDDEYIEYVFDLKDLPMKSKNETSSSTFQSPSKSVRTSDPQSNSNTVSASIKEINPQITTTYDSTN